MKALRNFIEQIGPRRAMLMGGVAAVMLAGIGYLSMRDTQPAMGFLYTDLDPSAAKSITDKLNAQGVPFQVSPDGMAVMAPVDRLADLRMSMAADQLGGKVGYEVLDAEQPFGISASRAKLNETRAVEGELAKSIESLERVSQARVHIVKPERAMFETEPQKASASVTVKTTGRLPAESVQAIRHLVASAVPGLAPEGVAVVDHTGALLARAGEGGDAGSAEIDTRQAQLEAKLRNEVENLVSSIVGNGMVRASVSAVLERDQVREQAETFDPDTQVIARQVTVESTDQSDENSGAAQGVTVGAQLPENEGDITGQGGNQRRSSRNETSEDITYQNSRTEKLSIRSPGRVARLTVAVMVDGGPKELQPAEIQRLQRLVENAVGFDPERGDSVVVENMSFAAVDGEDEDGSFADNLPFGLTIDHLMSLLKYLLIGGFILGAIRMLRPKAAPQDERGNREGEEGEFIDDGTAAAVEALAETSPEAAALVQRAVEGDEEAMRDLQQLRSENSQLDEEIALAEIDGRIKLSALKRIGDVIAAGPAESASVIRQWMHS